MNLNQAKKLARIYEPVSGRAALEQAAKKCTKLAAKYHPDVNGDKAAAVMFLKLIDARDFFEKRIPHGCPVCGVTIGRGATHCRIHQRGPAKSLVAGGAQSKPQSKRNSNARVDVSPSGGLIARFGFYATSVQKVFTKWQKVLGGDRVRDCFLEGASGVLHHHRIELSRLRRLEWQCTLEFGAALAGVMCDRYSPQSWLLNHMHVLQVADGVKGFTGWEEIAGMTGGKFSASRLQKAAARLRLLTPSAIAKRWRMIVKT